MYIYIYICFCYYYSYIAPISTADLKSPAATDSTSKSASRVDINWRDWLPYITAREHVQYILECLQNDQDVRVQVEVKLKSGTRYHFIHALKIMDPGN